MDSSKLLVDLFRAYYDARRNKRSTINALAFEVDYEKNLFRLRDDIVNRHYEIGKSIAFVVDRPVKREIFAADFRDRVVHHLVFNYLSPIFEKGFINDSYSCRIGKGTSYGIKRIGHFIRSCSQNYRKDCWILKLDIKSYFMTMDRNILFRKIMKTLDSYASPFIKGGLRGILNFDPDLLRYLLQKIVFNDPTENCLIKGGKEKWKNLPKSKSLFFAGKNKGFPIGNLTSQFFGNVYLDGFDHFVKHCLGLEYYGRYVDDIVIVHRNKECLKSVVPALKEYLQSRLSLELHPKKIYLQHFTKGVGFLGVFILPWRVYAGRRLKGNFYFKVAEINGIMRSRVITRAEAEHFLSSVNSYLGIMKHYNTYNLRKKMLISLDGQFWQYFSADPGKITWASIDTPGGKESIEGSVNFEGTATFQ